MKKILTGDHPALNKVCDPFDFKNDDLGVVDDLKALIKRHKANCVGLAAPQIGVLKRVFVVGPIPHIGVHAFKTFINPTMVPLSIDTDIVEEGCMSYPGVMTPVRRLVSCQWTWFDEKQQRLRSDVSGLLNHVLLHEFDHLNGICQVRPNGEVLQSPDRRDSSDRGTEINKQG